MATYTSIAHNFTPPTATTVSSQGAGAMVLIKSITASSDSTISFVNGSSDVVLDSTYKTYIFKYISIHPSASNPEFQVSFRDGGSSYDATKQTTYFNSYQNEDHGVDSNVAVGYNSNQDLNQDTGFQTIIEDLGNDNDQTGSGELYLFNPSSTTFIKHFFGRSANAHGSDYAQDIYYGGYCNVTAAIDAVQFKFSSGNIDSGVIKLYGIA